MSVKGKIVKFLKLCLFNMWLEPYMVCKQPSEPQVLLKITTILIWSSF